MLVEHVRNVLGRPGATHAEYEGDTGDPIITRLSCSLRDSEIAVRFAESATRDAYGCDVFTEKTTCDYGLRPDLFGLADSAGMRVVATDGTGEARAIEREDHPFFVGTLYQPQLSSAPGRPHPLFAAFLKAAIASSSSSG